MKDNAYRLPCRNMKVGAGVDFLNRRYERLFAAVGAKKGVIP
jgi:hypothetical protein